MAGAGFQLIRFNSIGRDTYQSLFVELQLAASFQLIRFNSIGRAVMCRSGSADSPRFPTNPI